MYTITNLIFCRAPENLIVDHLARAAAGRGVDLLPDQFPDQNHTPSLFHVANLIPNLPDLFPGPGQGRDRFQIHRQDAGTEKCTRVCLNYTV